MVSSVTDPRIPRVAYEAGQTYGQRLGRLLDGIYDASPDGDVLVVWDRLPQAHRALCVVMWAMAETDNGSLHQYFSNSSGQFASALPESARFFGADDYAEIFDRALSYFDADRIADRDYRNARLDELEATGEIAAFDRLTDEIHALEDQGEPIYAPIMAYVESHPEEFFT
jgi:uncharacterized protein DUF4375